MRTHRYENDTWSSPRGGRYSFVLCFSSTVPVPVPVPLPFYLLVTDRNNPAQKKSHFPRFHLSIQVKSVVVPAQLIPPHPPTPI